MQLKITLCTIMSILVLFFTEKAKSKNILVISDTLTIHAQALSASEYQQRFNVCQKLVYSFFFLFDFKRQTVHVTVNLVHRVNILNLTKL